MSVVKSYCLKCISYCLKCVSSFYSRVKALRQGVRPRKEIVVCYERWHLIGDVEETAAGVTIKNCSTIRYWGTTAGLGEIAVKGVTKKTILDYNGEVRVPTNSIVMRIKCEV